MIAQYVIEHEKAGERIRPSEIFEILQEDTPELNAILDLNYGDKLSGEVGEKFFLDSVRMLEKEGIEREISRLNEAYAKAIDEGERKAIAQKIAENMRKRSKLKK